PLARPVQHVPLRDGRRPRLGRAGPGRLRELAAREVPGGHALLRRPRRPPASPPGRRLQDHTLPVLPHPALPPHHRGPDQRLPTRRMPGGAPHLLQAGRGVIDPGFDARDIELTADFRAALALVEDTSQSLFVTGRAGTGKSTLLRHFRATTKKPLV